MNFSVCSVSILLRMNFLVCSVSILLRIDHEEYAMNNNRRGDEVDCRIELFNIL